MRRVSVVFLLAVAAALSSTGAASGQPMFAAEAAAQLTPALTEDWRVADYAFSARMMAADLNDDIFVVGDTVVGDYVVIKKFNAAGALLWQATYDPAARLRGVWVAVDGGGNAVVLATIITGSNATPAGWLTLKYDTGGSLLWARSLSGPFLDARRVAIDAAGNVYVAGRMWLTNPSGNTTFDSVLIKYAPDGTTLWTAVFDNGSAADEPYSLAISPDGSRIGVAGISGLRFMALMYDRDGNRLWARTGIADPANDLAFGPGNVSYFATATYSPQDPNPYQMAIVKFDAAGNQSWLKSYSVGDRTFRVAVDSHGNVVATGMDAPGYYMDWMTIKTDPSGNLLWSRRYDSRSGNNETANMLVLDASDAVYVTGTGGPNPVIGTTPYLKGVVAKYASDGTPQWTVWDLYANGKAVVLGEGHTLATLGFGYLVTTHYTETGLPDVIPAAPTNLAAIGALQRIDLSFVDNADNEFFVEVERCTGSGCTSFSQIGRTYGENTNGFRDTDIVAGVIYTYRVRAMGFMGPSGYSNTVEASYVAHPPAAPSNLAAAMSGVNVILTWQDNANDEQDVFIERCQGAGCSNFETLSFTPANEVTWTDFFAAAGQSYSYRVRAWNFDEGYSGYSNTATIVTPGGAPPPAPSNLAGQALNTSQIRLTWTNNGAGQDLVKIERCRGLGCTDFAQVAAVAGTATTYTDSGLVRNMTYRYRVRAHNSSGDSPYSNTATARTSRR